jgi:hypothetical protein
MATYSAEKNAMHIPMGDTKNEMTYSSSSLASQDAVSAGMKKSNEAPHWASQAGSLVSSVSSSMKTMASGMGLWTRKPETPVVCQTSDEEIRKESSSGCMYHSIV